MKPWDESVYFKGWTGIVSRTFYKWSCDFCWDWVGLKNLKSKSGSDNSENMDSCFKVRILLIKSTWYLTRYSCVMFTEQNTRPKYVISLSYSPFKEENRYCEKESLLPDYTLLLYWSHEESPKDARDLIVSNLVWAIAKCTKVWNVHLGAVKKWVSKGATSVVLQVLTHKEDILVRHQLRLSKISAWDPLTCHQTKRTCGREMVRRSTNIFNSFAILIHLHSEERDNHVHTFKRLELQL